MSVASTAAKVLFGRDLLRLAVESIGFLVLGFAAVVFVILLLLKSLLGLATSSANLGLLPGPDSGASAGPLAAIIPADQLAVMEQVAAATPCAIPWSVLAGVAYIESDFGQNLGPSSAGAYGYAQFLPGTWSSYGGNGIIVWDTKNQLYHRYFHSDSVLVSVGQHVDVRTPIGVLGATGTEGFPHVHYEVARGINGDPEPAGNPGCCLVDPRPFLQGEVPLP